MMTRRSLRSASATIHPELTDVLPEFARGYAAQSYVGHGAQFPAEHHLGAFHDWVRARID